MPTYTVKVQSTCSGGEHVTLGIYRDAVKVREAMVTKSAALTLAVNFDDLLEPLLRLVIKKAGATTMAQVKTAIEAAEWVI